MPRSTWPYRRRLSEIAWCCAIGFWLLAALSVWIWGAAYGLETYVPSNTFAHEHWPLESTLRSAESRPTLVFFLHPKCTCSRASIRELERLLDTSRLTREQQPQVVVLVGLPSNAPTDWRYTDIIKQASRLPMSTVVFDSNGDETTRFGAVVSGTVMLYRPTGERVFAGGVTVARGHEGDNAGTNALETLLEERRIASATSTPAFGCRLCVPKEAAVD